MSSRPSSGAGPLPDALQIPLLLLPALALLFFLVPQIDLRFSGLFYDAADGFFLKDLPPVQFSYAVFRDLPYWLIPILLWLWFASWRWGGRPERPVRRAIVYLLIVLLLGPGLLVNEVFKNHSGRARPAQVEQFNGDRQFSPAFVISDQCERNCSFVSGHAAMGFFFLAFAWALRDRRWLLYGGLIGALVGLGRITQGAHFLSDIVFSYGAVLVTAVLCARLILGHWSPEGGD